MSSQEFEGPQAHRQHAEGPEPTPAPESQPDRFERPDDEVAGYAAEVRAQLADLPDAESADLLEDLEDHLREVAAEDAGTLRERLGAPAAYASDLRQAAGLPEPGEWTGADGGPGAPGAGIGTKTRRTLRSRLRAKAQQTSADAERLARGYRAGREVLDFLPSLRPAWWVLRGWIAVRLLEVITTSVDPWREFSLIPQVGGSTLTGLLALLVAIPASVYTARHTVPDGWRRRAVGAGEGILVLFTVALVLAGLGHQADHGDAASHVSYVQQGGQAGLTEDGQPVSNLYVYDQSGKLLNGVLVYDQDGRPVGVSPYSPYSGGDVVVDSDGWLDGDGNLVTNIYPQRELTPQWSQTDGNTHFVAMPPPSVNLPRGLHHAPVPSDPQPTAGPTTATSPTTTPTTATTPTTSPTSTPTATATPPAATTPDGAHPASALPSTSAPPNATH